MLYTENQCVIILPTWNKMNMQRRHISSVSPLSFNHLHEILFCSLSVCEYINKRDKRTPPPLWPITLPHLSNLLIPDSFHPLDLFYSKPLLAEYLGLWWQKYWYSSSAGSLGQSFSSAAINSSLRFTLKNILLHHHCIITNDPHVWSSLILSLIKKKK